MINIYLDLETIPCQDPAYRQQVRETIKPPGNIKKAESILAWMNENAADATDEAVSKTIFDPAHGHICTIGYAIGDADPVSLSARTVEEERGIIDTFFFDLPSMGGCQFIGHNVAAFDLRFLLCRAIVLGVKIPHSLPRDIKPWSDTVFDTMAAWAGNKGTISQDRLAKALGLPGKGDFDGSMVAAAWLAGEHDKIAEYCRDDVETVRAIHKRFELVGY